MTLKLAIIFVFILLVISLFSALAFLFRDQQQGRRRTLYTLGIRLALASLLMGLVIYGILTGQLVSRAPWN